MKKILLLTALSIFLSASISVAQGNFSQHGKKRIHPPHGPRYFLIFPDERWKNEPPPIQIFVFPNNTTSNTADGNQPDQQKQQTIIAPVPVKDQPEVDWNDSISPPPPSAEKPEAPAYFGRGYTGRIEIGADGIARPSER